jgi:hypothetical protein
MQLPVLTSIELLKLEISDTLAVLDGGIVCIHKYSSTL